MSSPEKELTAVLYSETEPTAQQRARFESGAPLLERLCGVGRRRYGERGKTARQRAQEMAAR